MAQSRPPLSRLLVASLLTCVAIVVPLRARAQSCGFSPGAVPDGSYTLTCTNCAVNGTTLSCDCRNLSQVFVHTSIDITDCRTDPGDPMANINGVLTCHHCSAQGACCLPDASCAEMPFTQCQAQGDFQGENSTCGPDDCREDIVTWINGAGGDFGDANNWEPAQVPDSDQTAKFDIDGAYLVGVGAAGVNRLLVDRSQVSFTGGTLTAGELSLGVPSIRVRGGGRLNLASGTLHSSHAAIGDSAGGDAGIEIAGAGTTWESTGRLTVGAAAEGVLTIDHGASVTSAESRIAEGATGTATVQDTASWTTGNIAVGLGSGFTGTLAIFGGGLVTSNDTAVVGLNPGSHGEVIVEGVGAAALRSAWAVSNTLTVGGAGTGVLEVRAGGKVVTDNLLVPVASGADGEVRITGRDTNANVRSFLEADTINVGGDGVGRLVVEDGGQLNGTAVLIGPGQGTGTVTVRGAAPQQSTLLHHQLDVDSGSLAIEDGGVVSGDEGIVGPAGAVTIRGTGSQGPSTWELTQRLEVGTLGTGTVTLDGGVVRVPTGQFFNGTGGTITGVGTIEEVQPGGPPPIEPLDEGTIDAGVHVVNVPAPAVPHAQRTRSSVGAIGAGAATFTPGELTIEGNVAQGPTSVLRVRASGAGESGILRVSGDVTLGGTLEIDFVDGYVPKAGDAFTFLRVGGVTAGAFAQIKILGIVEGLTFTTTLAGGELTFTAVSDARPCAGGIDADGDGLTDCEVCDNCIDDNGDGLIDRADPDCAPEANSLGLGIGEDPVTRKALLKCAQTIAVAGAKLAAGTAKRLQACTDAVFGCVQTKPGDSKCLDTAKATCGKATAPLALEGADRIKARQKIAAACGSKNATAPLAIPVSALLDVKGLGYAAEGARCSALGVGPLASLDDVVTCIDRSHLCRATNLFAARVPRARELLTIGGAESLLLACVPAGAEGGGAGLGNPKTLGKLAAKCQKVIAAGGAKLGAKLMAGYETCVRATLACAEAAAPGQDACFMKAHTTCAKAAGGLVTLHGTADTTLAAAITKACGSLDIASVRAVAGLGFAAQTPRCAALDVPTVGSLSALATCLSREHACRTAQLGEAATPRLRELLERGGVHVE